MDEVTECNTAFKAGHEGYILIEDGPRIVITRAHAWRLLNAIADKALPFELANYAADCLIMSDDFEFEDELVREAIHFVEDDSVAPTEDETRDLLSRLS
ncbi:MAG: hypothetical protein V4656_05435 [Pseudomonadota bacterium]